MKGETKAAGFNSTVTTLRKMVSPDRFEAFVARLPPDTASLVHKPPIATSWLPFPRIVPLYEGAHRDLFGGSDEQVFDLGRRQMRDDLNTLYRIFMRVASPQFVVERATQIWGTYLRDAGHIAVTRNEDRLIEVLADGYPAMSPTMWHYVRGMIHGTVELTGVPSLKTVIIEGGGRGTVCKLRVTWG